MGRALALRDDYDGASGRFLAPKSRESRVVSRLTALATIHDGLDRSAAA